VLAATGAAEAGGQVGVVALGAAGGSLGGMPVEDEKDGDAASDDEADDIDPRAGPSSEELVAGTGLAVAKAGSASDSESPSHLRL